MRTIVMAVLFLFAVNAAWIALLMYAHHREEEQNRLRREVIEQLAK